MEFIVILLALPPVMYFFIKAAIIDATKVINAQQKKQNIKGNQILKMILMGVLDNDEYDQYNALLEEIDDGKKEHLEYVEFKEVLKVLFEKGILTENEHQEKLDILNEAYGYCG